MKNVLIFSLIINLTIPVAWSDCDHIERHQNALDELRKEIASLEKKSHDIITKDYPSNKMHEILAETSISGSSLLREQEEWRKTIEKIDEKQNDVMLFGTIPSIGWLVMAGINYRLYTAPPSAKPVFSEQLLRPVNGRILARTFAGVFLGILTGSLGWLSLQYYDLSAEADEARTKIDILGKLADMEDSIESKERILVHHEIALKILTETCSHP